ncbi:type II toxin-antitoxin system YafQ family toxin, partial [Shigella sp. SHS-2]|uniref:type II toxin-antitoxin system YafQ family toxin n=1 Tax=Shigella sp. SHS-2 TaxID=2116501 RepID=UPI0010080808
MTLTIRYKKYFKKDFKLVKSNTKLMEGSLILKDIIDSHVVKTATITDNYLRFPLLGNWKTDMECHI